MERAATAEYSPAAGSTQGRSVVNVRHDSDVAAQPIRTGQRSATSRAARLGDRTQRDLTAR